MAAARHAQPSFVGRVATSAWSTLVSWAWPIACVTAALAVPFVLLLGLSLLTLGPNDHPSALQTIAEWVFGAAFAIFVLFGIVEVIKAYLTPEEYRTPRQDSIVNFDD
ncbi:MAG: hypothetical protein WAN48_15745 [Actinomycetes bacterium]